MKYEPYKQYYVTDINKHHDDLGIEIVAKSRREAAKIFGLVLKHYSILKHLGGILCCVEVVLKKKVAMILTVNVLSYGILRITCMLNVLCHHEE